MWYRARKLHQKSQSSLRSTSLSDPSAKLSAVQPEQLQPLWLYEWAGTERLREHDREGGWMGVGGGAKGEPWLMKWLRFAKPWPAPFSLPNNPVTAGPSYNASIVVLACRSPHQTHNAHTTRGHTHIPPPSHLDTSNQQLPDQDAMKWNELRGGKRGGGRGNLLTSFFVPYLPLFRLGNPEFPNFESWRNKKCGACCSAEFWRLRVTREMTSPRARCSDKFALERSKQIDDVTQLTQKKHRC